MKSILKPLLGLAISAICIWLAAGKVDGHAVLAVMRRANLALVAGAAAFYLTAFWLRSWRWKLLLEPSGVDRTGPLFPIVMAGYAANNLLPARMGELVRAVALSRQANIRKTASLTTIVMERLFDGLTVLLILGAMTLFLPLSPWVRHLGILASFLFGGVLLFFAANLAFPKISAAAADVAIRLLPTKLAVRAKRMYQSFIEGISSLGSARRVTGVVLLSLATWAVESTYYFSVMRAVGLDASPFAAILAVVLVALGTIAPSAPGYVGTFQLSCVTALGVFGVPRDAALGYSVLLHVAQYIPVTAIGVAVAMLGGIKLFGMKESRVDTAALPEADFANPEVIVAPVSDHSDLQRSPHH